jgi:RNA polymerase-binding protein DksA
MTRATEKRWQWHREQLLAMRENLLGEVQVNEEEMRSPIESHSMDIADSATDEMEHDLAHGILAHETDALFEIDAALGRIADGSYGICEATGKPIPAERLRALPWTRFVREFQERLEKRQQIDLPHLAAAASIQGQAPGGLVQAEDAAAEDLITRESEDRRLEGNIEEMTGLSAASLPLTPLAE